MLIKKRTSGEFKKHKFFFFQISHSCIFLNRIHPNNHAKIFVWILNTLICYILFTVNFEFYYNFEHFWFLSSYYVRFQNVRKVILLPNFWLFSWFLVQLTEFLELTLLRNIERLENVIKSIKYLYDLIFFLIIKRANIKIRVTTIK